MADIEITKENITSEIQVGDGERLSGVQVAKIIESFDQTRYIRNKAYTQGKNPPIIADGEAKRRRRVDPNNIIPLPFARKTINDLQGYAYKPGNVVYTFEKEATDKGVTLINDILADNDEGLESAEIFAGSAINGEGSELLYYTDKIEFAKVNREQVIFEYEDTIKENILKWAIRFYFIVETLQNGDEEVIRKADVYYKDRVDHYQRTDKAEINNRNQHLPTEKYDKGDGQDYDYVNSNRHPFGEVPLHPYRINEDKLGVFESTIALIDEMDDMSSDSIANAINQFNDTILTMSRKVDKATAEAIRETKVIDDLGGKDEGNFAEFLQRELNIEGTLKSFKQFEDLYYTLTGIVNFNDDKFGDAKSGKAMMFALFGTENLVTTMEIYFSKGLQKRLELINNALINLKEITEPVEATLNWTRNLPFDQESAADVLKKLRETKLFSEESLLKMFPHLTETEPADEIKMRMDEDKVKVDAFRLNEDNSTDDDKEDKDDETLG